MTKLFIIFTTCFFVCDIILRQKKEKGERRKRQLLRLRQLLRRSLIRDTSSLRGGINKLNANKLSL